MCSHNWEPLREAFIGALWTRQLSLADVSFSPSARISTTLHPRGETPGSQKYSVRSSHVFISSSFLPPKHI